MHQLHHLHHQHHLHRLHCSQRLYPHQRRDGTPNPAPFFAENGSTKPPPIVTLKRSAIGFCGPCEHNPIHISNFYTYKSYSSLSFFLSLSCYLFSLFLCLSHSRSLALSLVISIHPSIHPIKQASKQATNQPINQSINLSTNQSSNQVAHQYRNRKPRPEMSMPHNYPFFNAIRCSTFWRPSQMNLAPAKRHTHTHSHAPTYTYYFHLLRNTCHFLRCV